MWKRKKKYGKQELDPVRMISSIIYLINQLPIL